MRSAEEFLQHQMTLGKQRIQVGIGLFERTHELLFGNPRIAAIFRRMGRSLPVVVKDRQSRRNRSRGFGFGSEKIVSFRLKYLKWG